MKFIALAVLALASVCASAQQDVRLRIDHFLDGSPFSTTVVTTNSLGEDLKVTRMEYYISQMTLIHDGGQMTQVSDTWVLANATTTTDVSLGSFPITYLEGIQIGIGVEAAVNHLDPATYPMSHPLAPKSPSMHWGWAPGYRFVAMEGLAGSGMSQNYEVHALGDANYALLTVPTQGVVEGNDLVVRLNADYTEALRGISVSGGLIVHGETGAAATLLSNFNQYVFTSSEGNAAVAVNEIENAHFMIFPNPTSGDAKIIFDGVSGNGRVLIIDALGRTIEEHTYNGQGSLDISLREAGEYHVQFIQDGRTMYLRTVLKL